MSKGFQWGPQLVPHDAESHRPSENCTSDRCSFSILPSQLFLMTRGPRGRLSNYLKMHKLWNLAQIRNWCLSASWETIKDLPEILRISQHTRVSMGLRGWPELSCNYAERCCVLQGMFLQLFWNFAITSKWQIITNVTTLRGWPF